ncbi:hypothetical protein PMAYCL1PPCAC_08385, partial [Pristionchus mayeri]
EIKEEPVEVKDETIDDFLDLRQPPISSIVRSIRCPSLSLSAGTESGETDELCNDHSERSTDARTSQNARSLFT